MIRNELVDKFVNGESEVSLFRLQSQYVRFGEFQEELYNRVWFFSEVTLDDEDEN